LTPFLFFLFSNWIPAFIITDLFGCELSAGQMLRQPYYFANLFAELDFAPAAPANLFSVAFLFFPATPPPSLSRHLQPSRYPRSAAIRVDVTPASL
jgi:hypothetical protein